MTKEQIDKEDLRRFFKYLKAQSLKPPTPVILTPTEKRNHDEVIAALKRNSSIV